jgi:hypothetical protein
MVALLAAVAAGLPVLATLAHGALIWVAAGDVAVAAWLVAYVTSAPGQAVSGIFKKKSPNVENDHGVLRTRRDTSRRPEFVFVATQPAEDHCSSLREAVDVLS